ncbi:MAG: hypothetical protein NDJ89_10685 [Oligoflexia bacterium]|nr:hypothetical protein [Oligoflexia bacterium]
MKRRRAERKVRRRGSVACSWIKVEDFVETSYWISIQNNTTGTRVPDSPEVELTEVAQQGLTLRLPRNACSNGHQLVLTLRKRVRSPLEDGEEEIEEEIQMTAKVVQAEDLDENTRSVEVRFYQYNELLWREFLRQFSGRQERVNALVKAIVE